MSRRPVIQAVYSSGVPGPDVWAHALGIRLAFSKDRKGAPCEGGEVRFVWNDHGLYVQAELEDSCLIATNRQDEQLHYLYGDVFELFVKPLHEPYKWEMYATPYGNKATLFFPTWPTELPPATSLVNHDFQGLEVAVEKTSKGWNAQMLVPVDQLTALGADWGPGSEWTVFCGRYNCNDQTLKNPELSMAPAVSKTNYHLSDEYALLEFLDGRRK